MREMKDSGVEWIGEIPIDWKTARIKQLFTFGKGLPITKDNLVENGVSVISYGQIHSKSNDGIHIQDDLIRYVDKAFLTTNSKSLVKKGDFIFADTSEDIDGCGNCIYIDRDLLLFAGYHTVIFSAEQKGDNRYLGYLFKTDAWRSQIRKQATGVKLFSISRRILSDVSVIMPQEIGERIRIADYLDDKCAKINSIVEKQQVIIEKLKEYKISIVIEYVTKGINTCHEYKDSNVEWIGTIPSEWKLLRLKYASEIMRGRFNHRPRNDPQYYDGEYPFVQTGDVARANKFITHYSQSLNKMGFDVSKEFPKGSICMTIAANIGDVAILGFDACFPDSIVGFVAKKDIYWEYLFYVLVAMKQQLNKNAIISTQLNLNIEIIKEEYIPCPSAEEQQAIVDYLNRRTALIEMDISKRKSFIDRLIDYKQAIIFETVTGKKKI